MAIKRRSRENRFKKHKTPKRRIGFGYPFKGLLLSKSKVWLLIKQRKFGILLTYFLLYFVTITIAWVILLRFINPPVTWLMVQRGFERKAAGKDWKLEKEWLSYEELSDNLKMAAIAGEDAHFMEHSGFDLTAIQQAYQKNQAGKNLRGGSTISQQTAKNVFLWPGRSWIRKGFESYFTVLIELFWGKKRILEIYLNIIEMGDGLYGANAAALSYYHKPATALTKKQAALLVSILPNPRKWSPTNPTAFINRKSNTIVRYMRYTTIPE